MGSCPDRWTSTNEVARDSANRNGDVDQNGAADEQTFDDQV